MKTPAKELTNHANLYIPVADRTVCKATRISHYLYDFEFFGMLYTIDFNSAANKDSFIRVSNAGLCAYVVDNNGYEWEVFTSPIDAFKNC